MEKLLRVFNSSFIKRSLDAGLNKYQILSYFIRKYSVKSFLVKKASILQPLSQNHGMHPSIVFGHDNDALFTTALFGIPET